MLVLLLVWTCLLLLLLLLLLGVLPGRGVQVISMLLVLGVVLGVLLLLVVSRIEPATAKSYQTTPVTPTYITPPPLADLLQLLR